MSKKKFYNRFIKLVCFWLGCMCLHAPLFAQDKKKTVVKPQPPVAADKRGKLTYAISPKGDRIPDYSYAGYMASEREIPNAPVKVTVPLTPGDATLRIQSALDYVATLPQNAEGIRGAVLLDKGTYRLNGRLVINASGVILRGSGKGTNGTTLIAAGTDRETFIKIKGKNDRHKEKEVKITDAYVPVNAFTFHAPSTNLKVGDKIVVHRPSNQAWLDQLKVNTFGGGLGALGWKPGQREIYWDRNVVAVNGDQVTIDAPITTALDTAFGGGFVAKYDWPSRIAQVGIENLNLESFYEIANPKDENHCWEAITIDNATDSWVRQVNFTHFAGSAVFVLNTSNRVTVEDCKSTAPVSEIGGQRRNTFLTTGGQTLFQRLNSEKGYHDFATGYCAPGPNAFVQCTAVQPYSYSGSIDSWASGVLFDIANIDAQALSYKNLEQDEQGAGWNAANSVVWNCTAAKIDCYQPPTAQNWSFGSWAQFGGDGYWESSNSTIPPRSFFYAQLNNRLNKDVSKLADILYITTEPSSSPTVAEAAALLKQARTPATTMASWIDKSGERDPINISHEGAKTIDQIGLKKITMPTLAAKMTVKNGWLVRGDELLNGKHFEAPWWNGTVHPDYLAKTAKPDITRWVPGQTGTGLTDDLNEVVDWMKNDDIVVLEHNYGLWYERRRDDHERIRRQDGDVWAPFYELPFQRSGQGSAYDGLSKWDVSKYNPWYWGRLKQFADLADEKGLVLFHNNFFQHNIIEAGAHYTDFPWRTANNINGTGFPEPVNYAGDKRQFMAEQFYEESDPSRHKLLVAYINKCMDNFADNNGVIQSISAEFTGPYHFAKFWVETVKQWEALHKKKEIISISATKDVQDKILADPSLSPTINVIDIRYWYYMGGGKLYAPEGGQSLAPRQQERLGKPKAATFDDAYQSVHEYKMKYPAKAILYSVDGYEHVGWAVFIAGGSLPALPKTTDKQFLEDAIGMKSTTLTGNPAGQYALGNPGKGYIVYTNGQAPVQMDLPQGHYIAKWIDAKTGIASSAGEAVQGGHVNISNPKHGEALLWLTAAK